jgi:hypothetical protein
VISISSGVGDCSLARKDPEELRQTMTKILQDFRNAYPTALIFTTSLTYPNVTSRSECNSLMNGIIQSASESSDVIYLNVSKAISNPGVQMTRDVSHLNDIGHALMAKKVIDLLKKLPDFSKLLER